MKIAVNIGQRQPTPVASNITGESLHKLIHSRLEIVSGPSINFARDIQHKLRLNGVDTGFSSVDPAAVATKGGGIAQAKCKELAKSIAELRRWGFVIHHPEIPR